MARRLPLEGVLVLDLTRAVAGPFSTMMLGDLGARVIKVEDPDGGDECRHWGPPFAGGESTYFLGLNRNKESVALDLKDGRGRSIAQRLAAKADIVMENFRPGVAARLGLGYPDLAASNPRLIYASVSGFGQDGPGRLKPGYDLIVQAMSGFMKVSAAPGGPPVKAGFPIADVLAAMFAGQAILAALYAREKDGQGRYVEISLLEGMLAAMCPATPAYLLTGEEPEPMGGGQSNIVPYQIFSSSDGALVVGCPNERLWKRFCLALDRADWLEDERYRNNRERTRHRSTLVPLIEAVLAEQTASHWLTVFEQAGVPCGPVYSIGEVFEEEQIRVRGTVTETEHPELGTMRLVRNPMRFGDTELTYKPPPRLGEQTASVLKELLGDDI